MPVTIVQSDLNNIRLAFDRVDSLFGVQAIRRLSDGVHERAVDYADVHTKTGALFRSIYKKPISGGYEIGADRKIADYALFVHWGTKPHVIEPKNKSALRWAGGGIFSFAKKVNHPGYDGDPFLTNAARDELSHFMNWMEKQLNDL